MLAAALLASIAVFTTLPVLVVANVIAERLSARLLILQCVFSVGGVRL